MVFYHEMSIFSCRFHGNTAPSPDSVAHGLGCQDIWETHVLPRPQQGIVFYRKAARLDATPEMVICGRENYGNPLKLAGVSHFKTNP